MNSQKSRNSNEFSQLTKFNQFYKALESTRREKRRKKSVHFVFLAETFEPKIELRRRRRHRLETRFPPIKFKYSLDNNEPNVDCWCDCAYNDPRTDKRRVIAHNFPPRLFSFLRPSVLLCFFFSSLRVYLR